jgi:hypothetical protein
VTREINELLHRNRRIQKALEYLHPRRYHVAPTSLWPTALGMVSSLPTLLFRFLRQGDLNALDDGVNKRITRPVRAGKRGRTSDEEGGENDSSLPRFSAGVLASTEGFLLCHPTQTDKRGSGAGEPMNYCLR